MKKIISLCLVIVLTIPLFSQEDSKYSSSKNVLKTNTLSLLALTPTIFYERKVSDMTSVQLGAGYMSYTFEDTKFSGVIITPEFRLYLGKNAINGFYLAPYVRYQNYGLKNTDSDSKGTLTNIGGGLVLGRQWMFNSGFTMDLFFGGHYGSSSVKASSGTDDFDTSKFSGFRTRVGFAIGFSF